MENTRQGAEPISVQEAGLKTVFQPKSVAVIGASATFAKWGQLILTSIVAGGFKGKIFPVNPKEREMCGLTAYPSVSEIPDPVDLAFVTTPAQTVPGVLASCGNKGVRGVVVITSGFSETDDSGEALEKEIVHISRQHRMLMVGPNTMGVIFPYAGLFATGSHSRPKKGPVAFISQSGNLGTQLIHWAQQQGIGISMFVGSGNEAMLSCTDYLAYLEHDPLTRIIVIYLESVGDGVRFVRVARRVNRKKPVIVLKGGRTRAGRTAAASHTGSMSGDDAIFRAACHQAGVLNARMPSELLNLSAGFSSLPMPRGNRVGIVTLGGGWGVVTSDECNERGLMVPDIPERTVTAIGRHLPPFWSKGNPVDLVGTRDPGAPMVAVEELLKLKRINAVICLGIIGRDEIVRLLTDSTRKADKHMPEEFLEQMEEYSRNYEEMFITRMVDFMEVYEKPVIGVTLARTERGTVRSIAGKRYSGVFYQTPEDSVTVLARMVAYARRMRGA